MIQPAIILLLLATISIASSSDCGAKFEGKCSCGIVPYNDKKMYVVNCTRTGFRDTSALEFLPQQTEVLIFTGNYIPTLPWNIFGTVNLLENLTIVDMSENHIREIRGKSYHHVPNVQRLILNHNNLSISRYDDELLNHHHARIFSNFVNLMELHLTNAFADNSTAELSEDLHDIFVNSNLTKLVKLHLEQNEISSFDDRKVFCDLPALRDLHLGDNLLKEINFNIHCLKHLRFLDLERNKFETIKQKDLTALDALENTPGRDVNLVVDFSNNPLKCDCNIYPFQEWLKETKVTVRNREYINCYTNKIAEEFVVKLKTHRCKLQISRASTTGHTVTLVFLLVVLTTILIALVAALLYVSKERIKKTFKPVMDTVSKKVQYTSIKDEEVQEVHV